MEHIGFYLIVSGFLAGTSFASIFTLTWWAIIFLVIVASGAGLAYLLTRRALYLVLCLVPFACAIASLRTWSVPRELPRQLEPLIERRVALSGTIVTQPDLRESGSRVTVETVHDGATTRIIAVAPPHARLVIGDRIEFRGVLKKPEPFATDGGRSFAYDDFLAKDGVFALMQPAEVRITGREERVQWTLRRSLQGVRDHFIAALSRALPEPESALAAGLIAGGKQGLGKEILAQFTISGLLPIVVLFGYNVMIVADGILRLLRFLPKRASLLAAGTGIALFVLAAGAGASAVRAGLMAVLGLFARYTNRTYAASRALFATLVLMLLIDPLLLMFDPGLQFSFVATLGLIIGAAPLERKLTFIRSGFFRGILASTIAAQAAVLPLLLFQTGNLSFVSILANLLALPLIPAAMGAGALAALAGLLLSPTVEPLVILLGLPAYALLRYLITVAKWVSGLPFAHVIIPAFPFWVVVLAYALFALLLMKGSAPMKARSRLPL